MRADRRDDAGDGSGNSAGVEHALEQVREVVSTVRRILVAVSPETLPRSAAHELACEMGTLEKLAAAATVRCARAAGREAPLLLATASGTATGSARRRLDVAKKVAASGCAPLADAFGRGDLSVDQAGALVPLADADPGAAAKLVESAPELSVKELRAESARLVHQRRSERESERSERLLHARRYCRTWTDQDGAVRLDARVGARDGAALLAALRQEHERLWRRRARGVGGGAEAGGEAGSARAHADQLRADALVRLVTGRAGKAGGGRAEGGPVEPERESAPEEWAAGYGPGRPELLVRVDAEALRRGEVDLGETCEIAGTGPVSVGAARGLLGEALWTLLLTTGSDIRTVTSTTRVIPRKVRNALYLRDRECVVPGCGETEVLEIDHWTRDFAWHGVTDLANLALVCSVHHAMKTRTGWQLLGGPGRWAWIPPKTVDELAEAHAKPPRTRPAGRDP